MAWEYSEIALQRIGDLFCQKLKQQLLKDYPYGNPDIKGAGPKYASGNLYNSITSSVEIDSEGNPVLLIEYADYFKYVNFGRQAGANKAPIPALLNWISIKGITARNPKGKEIPPLSLPFAIRQNTYKYGIRPTYIYDRTLEDLEDQFDNPSPDLEQELQEVYVALAEDLNIFLEKIGRAHV